MKKILYIVSTLEKKGPTNQLSYIIKNLDRKKYKPLILTLSPEGLNSDEQVFINLNVEIEKLNLSRIQSFLKGKRELKKMLKIINPDLIHSFGLRSDILTSKFINKYLIVCTLRNFPHEDYTKFGKVLGKLAADKHISIIKKHKNLIACSKSLATKYKEKLNIKVKYVRNGVDLSKMKSDISKEDLKNKLKFNRYKNIFVSVGSLIARKNPLFIIEAFNRSKDTNEDLLIFLGDGPLLNECKEVALNNKNIMFLGNVNGVSKYLNASDFFISSSLSEGLPNTVMEAMACGLPCILSNIPSHNEILNLNKDSGITFSSKSPKELTKVFNEIKNENYDKMKQASLSIVKKELNARNMSKEYQKIYLELLKINR